MTLQENLAIQHDQGNHVDFPHTACEKCFPVNRLVAKPSRTVRTVSREERIRHYTRNGIHYKVSISWHTVADGKRYVYIHVYRGGSDLPFRWLRWWTDPEGNFLDWG